MKLQKITNAGFSRYGRLLEKLSSDSIRNAAGQQAMPQAGVAYERSIDILEKTEDFALIGQRYGGSQPLQAGLCWGYNIELNGLEYHRASELLIAVTDLILMLGDRRDMQAGRYDTSKIEAFLVPAGIAVELYATTMHYAPCQTTADGFMAVIILPAATNAPLTAQQLDSARECRDDWENQLLFAVDKWLSAHPDSEDARVNGAFPGLIGKNLTTADFT